MFLSNFCRDLVDAYIDGSEAEKSMKVLINAYETRRDITLQYQFIQLSETQKIEIFHSFYQPLETRNFANNRRNCLKPRIRIFQGWRVHIVLPKMFLVQKVV